jgi:hypothetical protein
LDARRVNMNAQLELPGVVGSVAKLLDAARGSLSLDPQAAARYICEAAALLRVDTLIPDVVASRRLSGGVASDFF